MKKAFGFFFNLYIKAGTNFVIFAWNNDDPLTGNNDWKYHGSNRFIKVLMLLNFKNETVDKQTTLPSDVYTYTFRMNNVNSLLS